MSAHRYLTGQMANVGISNAGLSSGIWHRVEQAAGDILPPAVQRTDIAGLLALAFILK